MCTKETSFLPDIGSSIGLQTQIREAAVYDLKLCIYERKSLLISVNERAFMTHWWIVVSWNETSGFSPEPVLCPGLQALAGSDRCPFF